MIFLTRDDIDDVRWDWVINKSGQGLPYAYSWSLDQVAGKQWDAIISEDYTWVLPLPYNRKICGFKQYYTPYLIQQLGVIGDYVSLVYPLYISVQDVVSVAENSDIQISTQAAINVFDSVSVSESVSIDIPLTLSTNDTVSVSDHSENQIDNNIFIFDSVYVSENFHSESKKYGYQLPKSRPFGDIFRNQMFGDIDQYQI